MYLPLLDMTFMNSSYSTTQTASRTVAYHIRDVNNSLGCIIYSHPGLVEVIAREKGENASTISTAKKNTYMKTVKDRMMAMHFLMGADKIIYDDTITSYKNMYLMNKRNNYPATLHNAFVLMKGWTTTVNQSHHKVGVAFNTMGHDGENTHGEVNIAKGKEKYNGQCALDVGAITTL